MNKIEQLGDDLADAFVEFLKDIEESKGHCMSLSVNKDGDCVELYLDTSLSTFDEWIPGEGGDIGLIRDQDTKRVVGVRLPLLRNNLAVFHDGPLRVNDGFLKSSIEDRDEPASS